MKGARELLRERYAEPAYAFFEEIGNATAGRTTNYADALAMSLWPSRGVELHGFEIKAARSDLLRELKNPGKAEALAKYCNRWWLVVEDKTLIKRGELPSTWGLQAVVDGRLRTIVNAPTLTPQPWTPLFFASLLRGVYQRIGVSYIARDKFNELSNSIDAKVAERLARDLDYAVAERTSQLQRDLRTAKHELEGLRESIARFERAAGVVITENRWHAEQQGAAFKLAEALTKPGERIDWHQLAAVGEQIARVAAVMLDVERTARAAG